MSGSILLLDKPAGISSAAAIAQAKRKLKLSRIGHAGTLDPFATGLLVCLTGRATKLASYAEKGTKTYSGVIQFGLRTSTDDGTGEVLERRTAELSQALLDQAIQRYSGSFLQMPPQVSALKVNGQRAYDIARSGQQVDLKARPVEVQQFTIELMAEAQARFRIICSRGTYIRAIARDLGNDLGMGACLIALRREHSSPYSVSDAATIEALDGTHLRDWSTLFPSVPMVTIESHHYKKLLHGDLRVLVEIGSTLDQVAQSSSYLLYRSREDAVCCGLLERQGAAWKIGVNVASL